MENIIKRFWTTENIKTSLFDILGLTVIYLIPTLSHVFALPIYFIEPMRLMLIFAIVHTTKKNAYLLAITLPIFSTIVSSHPFVIKTGLIAIELLLNVWLFYIFVKLIKNTFASMFLAIFVSKSIYYVIKFILIQTAILNSGLISTPFLMQVITTLVFSSYVYLMFRNKQI